MTKENPWIEWDGGECPVEHGALVDVRHRDGEEFLGHAALVRKGLVYFAAHDWSHSGEGGDIIAYRLVKP